MTISRKVSMGVSIDPVLRQRLVDRAKKEKRTLSNLCANLIEEGLI